MTLYSPHAFYRYLAVGCLVLAAAMVWEWLRGGGVAALFFCLLSLALLVWSLRTMLSRIEIYPDRVVLVAPFAARREVEFRQLVSVAEEGRLGRGLILAYHPRQAQGLLDLDNIHTLPLPVVRDQERLRAGLETRVPA